MCHWHTKVMTARTKFIINFNNVEFKNRFTHLHQNCQNIENVKIAKKIYPWFRIKKKFVWQIDVFDNFRFFHRMMLEYRVSLNALKMLLSDFIAFKLFKWRVIDNIVRESFKRWFDLKLNIWNFFRNATNMKQFSFVLKFKVQDIQWLTRNNHLCLICFSKHKTIFEWSVIVFIAKKDFMRAYFTLFEKSSLEILFQIDDLFHYWISRFSREFSWL